MGDQPLIIEPDASILITGAGGFIGARLIEGLLKRGYRRIRCLVRPSSDLRRLEASIHPWRDHAAVELVRGNLLSREDCVAITKDAAVIYHLAAGRGEKLYADAFMNSVLTTRNLLEGILHHGCVRRFVNISSFTVYSNVGKARRGWLDESCPTESHPALRGDAYTYAKAKQDEIVTEYGRKHGLPYVIVRPGYVYGPGNPGMSGRIGIGSFGIFLHMGGSNPIPFTYVDNCAEAILLAGLRPGVDGEVFNVVDDDLPTSREFLRMYKREVRRFPSIYVPKAMSYLLCYLWEKYAAWSEGQLPPVYNRKLWHAYWKKTRYSNAKVKHLLGWQPCVAPADALARHFESCRSEEARA